MNPGTLRHRFTLEAPSDVPDGTGGCIRTFVRITDLWGMMHALKPGVASEGLHDGRAAQLRRFLIVMRFISTLSAGHRLRLGARILDITAVIDPDGLREQIHLYVEEVVP